MADQCLNVSLFAGTMADLSEASFQLFLFCPALSLIIVYQIIRCFFISDDLVMAVML